jgi:transcriptional regulator with XRE-family HTH domain
VVDERTRFSENLRRQRTKLGLSQMQLGDKASLHFSEVSLLERGNRDPRLSTIVKLARGLGIKPGRLLDGIE